MSDRGARWLIEGRYDTMQNQCSQRLYTLCERIFPLATKTYCLYSCRHQFVANMKELMTPAEVSAMVGHNITITAIENYGRQRSAWGPEDITERPSAIPEAVSLPHQRIHFFAEPPPSPAP